MNPSRKQNWQKANLGSEFCCCEAKTKIQLESHSFLYLLNLFTSYIRQKINKKYKHKQTRKKKYHRVLRSGSGSAENFQLSFDVSVSRKQSFPFFASFDDLPSTPAIRLFISKFCHKFFYCKVSNEILTLPS